MSLQLKLEFLIVAALIIAPFGGGKAHAFADTPEPGVGLAYIAPIEPIKQVILPNQQGMEPAAYPVRPIGTFSNPYPYGQCTYGAASMKGDIPVWGNANNWDDAARASGVQVSSTPIVGAIAQTDAGYYGHVAVVVGTQPGGVLITEMNYDYNGSVRTRWAPVSEFVYIYL